MPLLEVNNLSVSFKTDAEPFYAVHDLSFSLEPGESLAIVGESGSGKSVSLRAIMGLLPKKAIHQIEGEAIYYSEQGKSFLLSLKEKELRAFRGQRMSMIFQEPMTALNPVMRCGKQILESVLEHSTLDKSEAKKKVLSLLKEVRVEEAERIYQSYPHEISGGQRQRVMIAMALAGNPELLIADEPTTALDVSVQASILDLLTQLRKERNMALIFISHDLGVVKKVADKCLVMFRGKVLEQETTTRLFSSPQHIYTKALISCRPDNQRPGTVLPIMQDFFDLDEEGNFIEKPVSTVNKSYKNTLQTTPFIRVESIKVTYAEQNSWGKKEKKEVIRGLDFEIFRGETLGLLGESGSGKSTLGRAIMQLLKYDGDVEFDGEKLHPVSSRKRKELAKKMQLIYQDPYSSLNPRLRIGDSFEEILKIHQYGNKGQIQERSEYLLERVGLSVADMVKYPHEFSGGQRQRISIARALLTEPEFIVCDESVSALDVSVQAQVLNLLMELQEEFALTYLFITHDLQVVKHIADRILVLNQGTIADLQKTADLFTNPQDAYTKELLASYSTI